MFKGNSELSEGPSPISKIFDIGDFLFFEVKDN